MMQARQTADANGLALAVRMQLQQLATKLDARLPPSVPAVSPAVLANGPEPRLDTPERIAGDGSQQTPLCSAGRDTTQANQIGHRMWLFTRDLPFLVESRKL